MTLCSRACVHARALVCVRRAQLRARYSSGARRAMRAFIRPTDARPLHFRRPTSTKRPRASKGASDPTPLYVYPFIGSTLIDGFIIFYGQVNLHVHVCVSVTTGR